MLHANFSLMGESALLCDFSAGHYDEQTQRRLGSLPALLRSTDAVGQVVVGINNVLVSFDPLAVSLGDVQAAVRDAWERSHAAPPPRDVEHEIDVAYGGADTDLDAVAAALGLSAREIISLHTAPAYRVATVGFMPGWGYLTGLDERLVLPRRAVPKARVREGSVLIASTMTAILPLTSPTGWHVLGRTECEFFSLGREPHCLLACGDRVRFRESRS